MQKPVKVILGLEEPPCRLVAKELVRRGGGDPQQPCVVVVPTREAARLLKEQLALAAAAGAGSGAFLSPRIVPVSQLAGAAAGGQSASAAVSLYVWQSVLRRDEPMIFRLFPKTDSWGSEAWLHAASGMQQLFHTLAQEGVPVGGVAWQKLASEDSRWEVLLTLQQHYLQQLDKMGLQDPDSAPSLQVDEGTRVILACVPGLPRQVENLLAASSRRVEVWIACEEPHSSWFDAWGRPGREWLDTSDRDELGLARTDWKQRLIVAGDAWALAAETARATARANAEGGGSLHAVALGVCDPDLAPAIAEEFSMRGVTTYRPEGIPFSATAWQRAIDALADLAEQTRPAGSSSEPSREALPVAPLAELLRQPVITNGLDIPDSLPALRQLKELRARFLPDRVGFLLQKTEGCPELQQALNRLLAWLQLALGSGKAMLQALLDLAGAQPAENQAERTLAEAVRDACAALLDMGSGQFTTSSALLLLGEQLSPISVRGNREGTELSLNGWMELLYSPADRIVVAGMHDKQIPERWPVNPLLTRAARQCLGIRGDDDRAARDAYILRCLIGSRKPGRVCFTFSLFDIRKDPAAPSPLLFGLCPKNRLPEVVSHFFSKDSSRPGTPSPAFNIEGWHYLPLGTLAQKPTPMQAARLTLGDLGLPNPMQGRAFSPSMLADFLKCPLRFWLKRVRHIKDDDANEERETLQQRHVGDCLHRVLELFVRRYPSWESYSADHPELSLFDTAEARVRQDLIELFDSQYAVEYGISPLLPQQMQRENMAARLSAYARVHVELWKTGWHTALDPQGNPMVEYQVEWSCLGHRMCMTIDRIDEHITSSGQRYLRIIDYKTGKVDGCQKKHLAKLPDNAVNLLDIHPNLQPPLTYYRNKLQPHRWVELQLPLYVGWAMQELPPAKLYQAAYICLNRDPNETRLVLWGENGERDLFAHEGAAESLIDNSARWAKTCMDMIASGQCLASAEQLGWPPPTYDLFAEATEHAELLNLFLPSPLQ